MGRKFLNFLIILTLITMGISPACKFISGSGAQDFIEICASDGTLKRIALADIDEQNVPAQDHHQDMPDCMFCFAASDMGKDVPAVVQLVSIDLQDYIPRGAGLFAPARLKVSAHSPRAPPFVIVRT